MRKTSEQISNALKKEIHGQIFVDMIHRSAYSSDASIYRIVPACVVVPRDTSDIVTVVKFAAENNIPLAARGAGSGVAGESLCSGIVIDIRQYLNQIISIPDDGQTIECRSGVVLDDLNARLAKLGRKIGPDPSTSNRAVIGGCVANNSTGAHSLLYGYTGDYVETIEAVLADGSIVEFTNDFLPADSNKSINYIAKRCIDLLSTKETIIEKALPRSKRNRSGYNISGVCRNGRIDLAKMLAGSEGTLAIFTKIKLRTVVVPAAKALLELHFDSLRKMAEAVPVIVQSGASACELMDKRLLNMAVEALPQYRDILSADAEVVLLIEHSGDNEEEVKEKIDKTILAAGKSAIGNKIVYDKIQQKRLWKARKDAVPLLDRKKGRKHPIAFIEDVSVENNRLAEYLSNIERIAQRHNVEVTFYGHAGDGELHIRPYLDLADSAEVKKMVAIADDVFALAWSLGGSISGEHGIGLVRAAFLKRQYGNEYYQILRQVKNIFDPAGIMNPGKIISDDPDVMIKNLRAEKKYFPQRLKSELLFEENELELALEHCTGCGVCLSREVGFRMCPVFRAMDEELAGSRAKANILRFWATGQLDDKEFESQEFRKLLGLCINCKLCSVECPAGVDVSKLMVFARAEYARRKGLRPAELTLSNNRYLSMAATKFSRLSNLVTANSLFRWLLEKVTGLDRRWPLPTFEKGTFLKKARKYLASKEQIKKPIDRVAYFVDTFVNYNDHKIGFAVLDVLRHNDIEVILPEQRPVPLPALVYGDIKKARREMKYNVKYFSEVVKRGYKIICSEPSAALFLRQELKYINESSDAKLVSDNTYELTSYLLDLFKAGSLKKFDGQIKGEFVYHTPCHLFSMGGSATIELFDKWLGLQVIDLNAGCCGLAGTFGMQKKNYDLSQKIAAGLKDALVKTKADYILTECSACGMQIEQLSGKKVIHPILMLR
jgi:anaerobic glycerol-3-phosphate dehydrogenase C subunit